MSDFHPEEWSCLWSVSSILSGLLSFMTEESPTHGSIETTTARKRELAAASLRVNVQNRTFVQLYPHHVATYRKKLELTEAQPPSSESTVEAAVADPPRQNLSSAQKCDRIVIAVIIAIIALAISTIY